MGNKMQPADGKRLKIIFTDMHLRCDNPNHNRYQIYGSRGIKVCDEWRKIKNFYEWAMNNGYAENLTLDRKENDTGYSPENCQWATMKYQQNHKRNNHYITYSGETLTLSQWAEKYKLNSKSLSERLERGWSVDKALCTPCKTQYRNRLSKTRENEVA